MGKPVLLLNASYEPITTISVQRAIVMILEEEADMVSSYPGLYMRSPSRTMDYPSVVRLVKYVKVPRYRKAYLSRKAILSRDGHECAYCGGRANTMDHIVPRSKGGPHTWENVIACCFSCNQRKGNRSVKEMGWKLRFQPFRPEGDKKLVVFSGNGQMHPTWEPWLEATKAP